MALLVNSTKHLRINTNFSQKKREKGTIPYSFCKVLPDTKAKHIIKKLQKNFPYYYRCKNTQQNTNKLNPAAY